MNHWIFRNTGKKRYILGLFGLVSLLLVLGFRLRFQIKSEIFDIRNQGCPDRTENPYRKIRTTDRTVPFTDRRSGQPYSPNSVQMWPQTELGLTQNWWLKTFKSKIGKQVEFEDEVLDEDGRRRSFGRTGKDSEVKGSIRLGLLLKSRPEIVVLVF